MRTVFTVLQSDRGVGRYWLLATIFLGLILGCHKEPAPQPQAATPKGQTKMLRKFVEPRPCPPTDRILFDNVSSNVGLDFVLDSGARGALAYPEIVFGGACLADLDGDGDVDAYLPQGGTVPGAEGPVGQNALFLNDGTGTFQRAPPSHGADHPGYGMGAFAADTDDDGDLDLLLTNAGALALLRNIGGARFEDATLESGIPQREGVWLNAAFADFDGDLILDIYVANYVDWNLTSDVECHGLGGQPDYCNPSNYEGAKDLLLKGNGDGTYQDMTDSAGIGMVATRSMGVVAFDADKDGDQDIYVANDGESNLLWINDNGKFKDEAQIRGAAVNSFGIPEASMGIACADIDVDGDEDLILTHLAQETNTVYRNDGGYFTDATVTSGIGSWSRPDTGFGIGLVDFNNDQRLDLFVANGAVIRPSTPVDPTNQYAQPDRWAVGLGDGRFPTATVVQCDRVSGGVSVSRGAAFGDVDGDGLVDVLLSVKDEGVRLLRNMTPTKHSWIIIKPTTESNVVEIGSRARVLGIRGLGERVVRPHGSYLGSSAHEVHFGLGNHERPIDVLVTWRDGSHELFSSLALRQKHHVVRSSGTVVDPSDVPTLWQEANRWAHSVQPRASQENGAGELASQTLTDERSTRNRGELGPMPELEFAPVGTRGRRTILDIDALALWCDRAGLPPPPRLDGLDPAIWELVHPAIEKAGREASAESLGSLAMFYHGHSATAAAIALYERVVLIESERTRWWHLLGQACAKQGKTERAVEALRRAVDLAPEQPVSRARLALAYLSADQPRKAIGEWKHYLRLQPPDVVGYTHLAQALEATGDFKSALKAAIQAIQLDPNAQTAMILAARVSARLGEQARAQEYQSLAASADRSKEPKLVDHIEHEMYAHAKSLVYLQALASHLKASGRYAEALGPAKLIADRRPKVALNWQLLVWLTNKLGQHEDADRYARIAVEVDPNFAPGWDTIARTYVLQQEPEKALAAAEQAIRVDPTYASAHGARGAALAMLKRYDEALPELNLSIQSNLTDAMAWQMKIGCLCNLGRIDEALTSLDQMLTIFPGHRWATQVRIRLLSEIKARAKRDESG